MKILVTGSHGFIGSHVVKSLEWGQHDLTLVDNMSSAVVGPTWYGKRHTFIQEGFGYLQHGDAEYDAVVHCAAIADIHNNWNDECVRDTIYDQARMTAAMLDALPKPIPIVFLSTCAVYGSHVAKEGATEDSKVNIESPYAASKLACEAAVQAYAYRYDVPFWNLRLVSNVGTRYTHGHVSDFVAMAKKDGVIRTKDNGLHKKPYIHVEDTADTVRFFLEKQPRSGVYNVSSKTLWSWRDTVTVMGSPPVEAPSNDKGSVGDPQGLRVNTDKLDALRVNRAGVSRGVSEALIFNGWFR